MRVRQLVVLFLMVGLISFPVLALSNSGSSSGSGSSSSGGTTISGGSLARIQANVSMKRPFFGEPVSYIKLELNETVYTGMPLIGRVGDLSENITPYNDSTIHIYFEVVSKINSSYVKFSEIKFVVKKAWLEENDVNVEDVVLMYLDEEWKSEEQVLPIDEDDKNYYFVSDLPWFQYFAIAERPLIVEEVVEEGTVELEIVKEPVEIEEESGGVALFWISLLVVLGLILVLKKKVKIRKV